MNKIKEDIPWLVAEVARLRMVIDDTAGNLYEKSSNILRAGVDSLPASSICDFMDNTAHDLLLDLVPDDDS